MLQIHIFTYEVSHNVSISYINNNNNITHRGHERIQHADGERGAASERLREVQLGVWIVVVVLIQELYVGVVDELGDHGHVGPVHRPLALQDDRAAKRRHVVRRDGVCADSHNVLGLLICIIL